MPDGVPAISARRELEQRRGPGAEYGAGRESITKRELAPLPVDELQLPPARRAVRHG